MDKGGPDENDNNRYGSQKQTPGRAVRIEAVKENTALFSDPTGCGNEEEPGEKRSWTGFSEHGPQDIISHYG